MTTILLIEDNLEVRENIAEILTLSGYNTIEAANGIEGIKLAQTMHPDLILCDVMMPELDGYGVLKILSNNQDLKYIPFIFLTAKSEQVDLRKGMSLGADDYIMKPFDDTELLQAIEIRLSKHPAYAPLQSIYNEQQAKLELDNLAVNAEKRHLRKREIIFETGKKPRFVYRVDSGHVKVYLTNEHGKELITNVYTAGDYIGLMDALRDTYYHHTAAVTEDAIIREIPLEQLEQALHKQPGLNYYISQQLAEQVEALEAKMMNLAYSSVRKRVANALLLMYEKNDNKPYKRMREDLASIAATAKETLIRTMSDFKDEGLIDIKNGSIEMIDVKTLQELSQ